MKICEHVTQILGSKTGVVMISSFFPRKFTGTVHTSRREFVSVNKDVILPPKKVSSDTQTDTGVFEKKSFAQTIKSFI